MFDVVFVTDFIGNSFKYLMECFFFIIWTTLKMVFFLTLNISKYLYEKIIYICNGYKDIKLKY